MNTTMRLFGRTVGQVAAKADTAGVSVRDFARGVAAVAALAAACHAVDARAQGGEVMEQFQDPQLEQQAPQTQANGDKTARNVGAAIGGVVGAVTTQGRSTFTRLFATFAGAAVGGMAGNAVAGNDVKPAAGQQLTTNVRDSRGNPMAISRSAYEASVAIASAPFPQSPAAGLRQLDARTHQGIWAMAVDVAAYRSLASMVGQELDKAQIARAVNPRDKDLALRYEVLNRSYKEVFDHYSQGYQAFWNVVKMAERSKFDVSAHRTAMSVIPGDLSQPAPANLNWPGLDARITDLGDRFSAQAATNAFEDHIAMGGNLATAPRPRQR